jgi:hypothetical protein
MRFWSSVAHHFAIAASSAKREFGKEPMGVPMAALLPSRALDPPPSPAR